MKKAFFTYSLILALAATLFTFGATTAQAEYVTPTPAPYSQLNVDKKILNPQNNNWADNLNVSDFQFLPGQEVKFNIEVRNNGQVKLENIYVEDKFPDFVEFVSGTGNYDKTRHILSWNTDKLEAGEAKNFEIRVKIKNKEHLPMNGSSCITNFVKAQKDNLYDQDNAVFCFQTKILGTTTELPKTGPSAFNILLSSSVLFSLLALGLATRQAKA